MTTTRPFARVVPRTFAVACLGATIWLAGGGAMPLQASSHPAGSHAASPNSISWGLTGGNAFNFSMSLYGDGKVVGKVPRERLRVVWHFGTVSPTVLAGLTKLADAEGFRTWPTLLVSPPNRDLPDAFVRIGSRTVYAYEARNRPAEANFNQLLAVLRAVSRVGYCGGIIPCRLGGT